MRNYSKIFGFCAALLALCLFASTASAQGKGKGGPGKGGAGQGKKGGPGGQDRGQRDPEEMVKRMIKQFDKDGDKALNARELMAMFKQMREGRGQRGPGQRGPGQGGPGRGGPQKGGFGKGKESTSS